MTKSMLSKLNPYLGEIVATIITLAISFWLYGCQSTVLSLNGTKEKITRDQLQFELDSLLAAAEKRFADLDRQDEFKKYIIDQALIFAQGGTLNPIGVFTALAAIGGVGATVDSVRTRKKLTAAKKRIPKNADKVLPEKT